MKKGSTIIFYILLVIIAVSAFYFFIPTKISLEKNLSDEELFEKYCTQDNNEYSCNYCLDKNSSICTNETEARGFDEKMGEICSQKKGIYYCTGMCLPFYPRACSLKLADGGKSCINSNECSSGACVLKQEDKERLNITNFGFTNATCEDCTGTCLDYSYNGCKDHMPLLENGKININFMLCD